jgi:hypothetical protein
VLGKKEILIALNFPHAEIHAERSVNPPVANIKALLIKSRTVVWHSNLHRCKYPFIHVKEGNVLRYVRIY